MLKKIGVALMVALISIGTFSITEAEQSDNQNYCCRGGYCYNQNCADDDSSGGCYNGGGCYRNGRGCWYIIL